MSVSFSSISVKRPPKPDPTRMGSEEYLEAKRRYNEWREPVEPIEPEPGPAPSANGDGKAGTNTQPGTKKGEPKNRKPKERIVSAEPSANGKPAVQDTGRGDGAGKSAAAALVELAESKVELWHDGDTGYATFFGTGKTMGLASTPFRRQLSHWYYLEQGKVPGGESVRAALDVLIGCAVHKSPADNIDIRLAQRGDAVYLDLGRDDWLAVKITGDGWELVTTYPARFRHPRGMLSLPLPAKGGSLNTLRELLNLGDGDTDWYLLVGWLLVAMRPVGPYPVLILTGEQGAAKSTTARVLRGLIDPNVSPLRSEPRNPHDLAIAANNGWLMAFDNLSDIRDWLSDCLSRLATGGGFATRELFTDGDEMLFDAQRPIILTSIEDIANRSDLLDRAVILRLPSIPEEKRVPEADYWRRYESERPRILGALLDIVAVGLRNLPTTRLERLPRMADFAIWVSACEGAIGWQNGTFLSAYSANIGDANELALDSSPLTSLLRQLMATAEKWEGTASQLLSGLTQLAGEEISRGRDWPSKPNVLSGRLKRLAPNLRKVGIDIAYSRDKAKGRTRTITISAAPETAKTSSAPSEPSDTAQFGANAGDLPDDNPVVSDDVDGPGNDDRPSFFGGKPADWTIPDGPDDLSDDIPDSEVL